MEVKIQGLQLRQTTNKLGVEIKKSRHHAKTKTDESDGVCSLIIILQDGTQMCSLFC